MKIVSRLIDQITGRKLFKAIKRQTALVDSWIESTKVLNDVMTNLLEDQERAW